MIEAYTNGVGEVVARLDALNDKLHAELMASVSKLTIGLQRNVVEKKLQGQVLGVRSGDGQRSIAQDVQANGDIITGVVSTNLFYMVGWELGWPDRAMAAAKGKFNLSGTSDTFANGTPKKRAFLVPSLQELAESGAITEGINAATMRAKA